MLAWVLSMAVAHVGGCATEEVAVLSCRSKAKQLALCAGPAKKPTWLQVRFGPSDTPELVFPTEKGRGFAMFRYARRDLLTGTSKTLTFTTDKATWEVWWQDGKDGGTGINVLQGETVASTFACTELQPDNWDVLEAALAGPPPPPPNPLAGKTQKEICQDDSLLLLKYSFDDLRFKDGFKKNCCWKGALGNDDRCELDWPASDVPLCSDVDLWRNSLFALYGYPFKDPKFQSHFDSQPWYQPRADFDDRWLPAIAQKNVTHLKALVAGGGCVAEPAAPPVSAVCTRAGLRWSLQLQKSVEGKMDGMQQADIAETIAEQCAGWDSAVAVCLADDNGAACLSNLTDAQRRAAWSAVKAISPDLRETAHDVAP